MTTTEFEVRTATRRRWIGPVTALVLFAAALAALQRELRTVRYSDLVAALHAIPAIQVAAAFGATIVSYLVLTGYDFLAIAYIRGRVKRLRIAFASMVSYGVSHMLGFAVLTGGAVRVRLWTAWGLSSGEIATGIGFASISFVLGIILMAGLVFTIAPAEMQLLVGISRAFIRAVGVLLLAIVTTYVAWSVIRRHRVVAVHSGDAQSHVAASRKAPVRIGSWALAVPSPALVAGQLLLAICDWIISASVLWLLLPRVPAAVPFLPFLGAFLLAQFVAVISHVPGGVGVFESVMVTLMAPHASGASVLAALLAYRGVYYLFPFVAATGAFGLYETREAQARLATATVRGARASARLLVRVGPEVVPFAASVATFAAGALLLLTGATPELRGRVVALDEALPLGIIEASHFLASLAGAVLIVVAWALRRRLDAAWGIAVLMVALGIAGALLRGLDYEEASLLLLVLMLLLASRRAFNRRAALTSEPFTPGWFVAVCLVFGVMLWLGLFSYKHVQYRDELWWQFTARGDAPRFLRATVGALGTVMLFGLHRLLRHAAPAPSLPTKDELDRAALIVATSPVTEANLALLGDKSLLFSDSGRSFVMYAVEGRSWVALGDPIGPPEEHAELAWRFREKAAEHGGWTVFYQVSVDHLPLYIDLGLTLLKLGEEARVRLDGFSLDGASRKSMRRMVNGVDKGGARFEIAPADAVPALIPELRRVSDEWIARKQAREKGFSLGYFDENYLARSPVALVYAPTAHGERIVAFANMWCGAEHRELSVDLMRYSDDAPDNVMEYLFVQLMFWGKAQGYAEFNLGMAPLSGFERRSVAPLWTRAGALIFRHGENFYNFQGLRRYKEKFDPIWEPRYLASPGGLPLPRILANVTALIARGLGGVVAR